MVYIILFLSSCVTRSEGQITSSKILTEGSYPTFHPSGTKIAYLYRQRFWIADLMGKERKPKVNLDYEAEHCWSPDWKKIVFSQHYKVPKFELWIMNSDGSNSRRLIEPTSDPDYGDQIPIFSPDGEYIVWTRVRQLWIMDSSGNNAHPLTREAAKVYEYVGDWSPDGKFIAYLKIDKYPHGTIWLIKPDGEDQRALLNGISADHVKWSRDSNHLYYSVGRAVWKIAIDGKSPAEKVFESTFEHDLGPFDISSDEQWLVFENPGIDNIESTIHLVNIRENR